MIKIFLIPIFLVLFSCGDSPLLSDEKPQKLRRSSEQVASGDLSIGNYTIRPQFDGVPVVYEDSPFIFLVMDKSGKLLSPENEFEVYLWMPDHGHGSSPVAVEKISKGIYGVKDVFFVMPGLWDIHFKLGSKSTKWSIEL